MTEQMQMFGEVISEIAEGPSVGGFHGLTKALMVRLSEKGWKLEDLSGPKMMNRSLSTLQKHAREYELTFPDYVPMGLRKIVQFKLTGDFYEAFGDDAKVASDALGLTLTESVRDGKPMCGFPAHAAKEYREKLEAAFIRVRGLPRG